MPGNQKLNAVGFDRQRAGLAAKIALDAILAQMQANQLRVAAKTRFIPH
jgi:hypothetical protein